MTKSAITIDLPVEIGAALDRLVDRTGQPRASIMVEAIQSYVGRENAFHDSLDEADAEFERGEFVTHEEMVAQIRARRQHRAAA